VLSVTSLEFVAISGLLVGVAIGCTGVGGVLLVPSLVYGAGLPVREAIALALYSYLLSGVVAVFLYARRGSIPWRAAGWLCLGALPGAFLGARAVAFASGALLQTLLAVALGVAGLQAAWQRKAESAAPPILGAVVLAGLGGVTGFLSALVGGGGAFVLVPLLVALGQPLLLAVGLGQVIQLPISAVASYANLHAGLVDVPLGTGLAVCLALGIAVGTPVAHALPQRSLRRVLALTMLLAGLAIGVRLLVDRESASGTGRAAQGAHFFARRH
jgi:uncharacterized protein